MEAIMFFVFKELWQCSNQDTVSDISWTSGKARNSSFHEDSKWVDIWQSIKKYFIIYETFLALISCKLIFLKT